MEEQLLSNHVPALLDKGFAGLMSPDRMADLARLYRCAAVIVESPSAAEPAQVKHWHCQLAKCKGSWQQQLMDNSAYDCVLQLCIWALLQSRALCSAAAACFSSLLQAQLPHKLSAEAPLSSLQLGVGSEGPGHTATSTHWTLGPAASSRAS